MLHMGLALKFTISQEEQRQISVSQVTGGKGESWSPVRMSVVSRWPSGPIFSKNLMTNLRKTYENV